MNRRQLRVYADTSVFGGCFDEEFARESESFLDEIRAGKYILVLSAETLRELEGAPERVQAVLSTVSAEHVELIPENPAIQELRDAYLSAGVVGKASKSDAEHVAAATVGEVDMIVSWNFKHIVHYDKIRGYNGVNMLMGYEGIEIYSPREVIEP